MWFEQQGCAYQNSLMSYLVITSFSLVENKDDIALLDTDKLTTIFIFLLQSHYFKS